MFKPELFPVERCIKKLFTLSVSGFNVARGWRKKETGSLSDDGTGTKEIHLKPTVSEESFFQFASLKTTFFKMMCSLNVGTSLVDKC